MTFYRDGSAWHSSESRDQYEISSGHNMSAAWHQTDTSPSPNFLRVRQSLVIKSTICPVCILVIPRATMAAVIEEWTWELIAMIRSYCTRVVFVQWVRY